VNGQRGLHHLFLTQEPSVSSLS